MAPSHLSSKLSFNKPLVRRQVYKLLQVAMTCVIAFETPDFHLAPQECKHPFEIIF